MNPDTEINLLLKTQGKVQAPPELDGRLAELLSNQTHTIKNHPRFFWALAACLLGALLLFYSRGPKESYNAASNAAYLNEVFSMWSHTESASDSDAVFILSDGSNDWTGLGDSTDNAEVSLVDF